jgi:hypothetical protein
MTNGFHLNIVVVIKMANPQDRYDHNEVMMNIINGGDQYGAPNQNEANQEFNAYLANLEVEQQPQVQEPHVQQVLDMEMVPTGDYDPFQTYKYGQSLVNPDRYTSLGT